MVYTVVLTVVSSVVLTVVTGAPWFGLEAVLALMPCKGWLSTSQRRQWCFTYLPKHPRNLDVVEVSEGGALTGELALRMRPRVSGVRDNGSWWVALPPKNGRAV